ncbi:MAG: hypothetical protein IJS69_00055, partial [Selenomonadaceae bacterium]|nr:hypothetical protein [Selenomonadaceae bacterium]
GPSAGTAILSALVSAVTGKRIRQDVAVTGEISLQGRVRPVGGVFEKAYGAKQAGIKILVIPKENAKDIPRGHLGLKIFPVETAEEAFKKIFADEIIFADEKKISLTKDEQIKKISSTTITPEELEMLTGNER